MPAIQAPFIAPEAGDRQGRRVGAHFPSLPELAGLCAAASRSPKRSHDMVLYQIGAAGRISRSLAADSPREAAWRALQHGARDGSLARAIAKAVKDFDSRRAVRAGRQRTGARGHEAGSRSPTKYLPIARSIGRQPDAAEPAECGDPTTSGLRSRRSGAWSAKAGHKHSGSGCRGHRRTRLHPWRRTDRGPICPSIAARSRRQRHPRRSVAG